MKYLIAISLLFLSSCATLKTCPSESEESVSICRAEKACKSGMKTFGVFLGGLGGGTNYAAQSIESCMDNNIAAQKANAGIQSNNYKCKTVETYKGVYETKCENN